MADETNVNTPEPAEEPKPETEKKPEPAPKAEPEKEDSPSAEELAEFRKWQESRKTESEKKAAELGRANKAKEAAEARAAAAELKLTAMSKGVSADALDDVIALARTKITDKVTAEQAIEEIVKKYPAFAPSGTTGAPTKNNHDSESFNEEKARRIMGLPPKNNTNLTPTC